MRSTFYHMSFFKFIYCVFGLYNVRLLKQWVHHNHDLVKIRARNKYLLQCKMLNLVPKHLTKYRTDKLKFFNDASNRKAYLQSCRFMRLTLNLEIMDNLNHMKFLTTNIHRLTRSIERNLPLYICNQFFITQQRSLVKLMKGEHSRLNKKLTRCCAVTPHVHRNNVNDTKIIKYICRREGAHNNFTLCNPDSSAVHLEDSSVCVKLDPSKYAYTPRALLEPRENWFINISKTIIPKQIIGLLQLGEGFCLPPENKRALFIQIIKHLENNFSRFGQHKSCVGVMRNQLFNFLKPLHKLEQNMSNTDLEILDAVSSTKRFVKNNFNILFTKADKGNTVVALDKNDYIKNMEICLSDSDTYTIVKRDPVNKLIKDLKTMLKRWLNLKYISSRAHSFLQVSGATLPRAYGLPKIHKAGYPLRIIVSSTGSPLHGLATFLHKILSKSLPPHFSHINNSLQLIEKLSGLHIPDDHCLASFDVISLFTNVPIDMVLLSVREKWDFIKAHTSLPLDEFILSLRFVLESTYFLFNKKVYKQTFGTPMGSPLSPVVADLVLQKLELSILDDFPFKPIFYFRYVDDIALSVPRTFIDCLLDKFNSFHHRLKFTMEMGGDGNHLNFLDLTIIKKNNSIIFNWFRKPTFSGRFLNFHSHHPFNQKRGTMHSLIDRVIRLSHPEFQENNFDYIINVLLDNGYPLDTIFSAIRERLYTTLHRASPPTQNTEINADKPSHSYFTIPYVSCIAKNFMQFFNNISFTKLSFSGHNKLSRFIKVQKDSLPSSLRSNVVYQLNCRNCNASYVGQTKRSLSVRVNEHRSHIIRNSSQQSVITEHRLMYKHDFDWDNAQILDEETNYNKRLISEMIFIKKQKFGLNAQTDTELLDPIYNDILSSTT